MTIDGSVALTLQGGGVHFPPEAYQRFRSHQQATRPAGDQTHCAAVGPIDPARVGRRDIRNVVIGAARLASRSDGGRLIPLVVDQRHPSFFDHPYDHVPGPLLLEGCRQAAIVTATEVGALMSPECAVTACAITFSGFAELGPVIGFSAVASANPESGGAKVELGVHQFDTQIAECRIEFSPYPESAEKHW